METWLNLPWSCGCHCGDELTQRGHCENSYDDEVPMRFVEDLEELTNVDVFLEKMVNRCALPPGSHLTVLVAGEGSRSSMLCNLMAGCKKEGEKVFDHQRGQKVQCWEAADGALRLMEMNLAQLEVPDSERRSQASNALEDLLLGAHRGINVMLYVVPFGPVSEEVIQRLIFLTQYLLNNEILLHFHVVVTDVPSSLRQSDWISPFADTDPGFRHLYRFAGKNPCRFISLPKVGQDQSGLRETLLSSCGRHPVHMMPAFRMKMMQEVLALVKVERDKLDEKQRKVARLRSELEHKPWNQSQKETKSRTALRTSKGTLLTSARAGSVDDANVKLYPAETRELCQQLEQAEDEVKALQGLLEKKLQEVKNSSSFKKQVDDWATAAGDRFLMDLEEANSAGAFVHKTLEMPSFHAFGYKAQEVVRIGSEPAAGFEAFVSMSASRAMANSEDRPPALIFDWDDTLCPTSWMRQFETIEAMDSMKLQLHAGRVEQVLRAARSFGYVDIVTMANHQWLEQTIQLLKTPDVDLWNVFQELDIQVHYAPAGNVRLSRVSKGPDPREGVSAKKVAMSAVLDKYYGDSVKARVHVVSFGDQDTEAIALQEVLQDAWSKSWLRPICKVLRLQGEPDLKDLGQSLQKILTNLPAILRADCDLDLHMHSLEQRG